AQWHRWRAIRKGSCWYREVSMRRFAFGNWIGPVEAVPSARTKRSNRGNSGAKSNTEVAVVSILSSFARRFLRRGRPACGRETLCATEKARISRFEQLEVRNPLTADIHLGSVYLEPAKNNDSSPNLIEVTFQGGAPGTQLTHLVING